MTTFANEHFAIVLMGRLTRILLFVSAVIGLTVWPAIPVALAQTVNDTNADAAFSKLPAVMLNTAMDLEEIEVGPDLSAFLRNNKGLLGGVKPAPITYAAALTRVRGMMKSEARAKEISAIRAHPQLQTPQALMAAAAGAVLRGAARDAMDRLLIAAERWPENPEVLFNIAGLLAQQGLPNEATAVLGEIDRRGTLPAQTFGIQPSSAIQYLRGYSHMQLGNYQEAAALLRPIVKQEAAFAEAALTLALLEDKLGNNPRPAFLQGVWRRSQGPMTQGYGKAVEARDAMTGEPVKPEKSGEKDKQKTDDDSPEEVEDIVILSAEHFIDLSRGRPGVILSIYQPTNVIEYSRYFEWLRANQLRFLAEAESLGERLANADNRWREQKLPPEQMAWLEALSGILSPGNARVREVQRRYHKRDKAAEERNRMENLAVNRFQRGFDTLYEKSMNAIMSGKKYDMCPELRGHAETLLSSTRIETQAVDREERLAYRLWHQYATALGASVGNKAFRDYVKITVEVENFNAYGSLLVNMYESGTWAELYQSKCQSPASSPEAAKKQAEEDLAPCSEEESQKVTGFSAMDFISVEKTCNGMSVSLNLRVVELSGGVTHDKDGWIQDRKIGASAGATDILSVSGEIGSNKQGETTIYVGPKAGGKVGVGPASVEVSQQGGVYVTTKNGKMSDWGVKSVTTAKASAGPGQVGKSVGKTVSFVPSPSRPGGLQQFTPGAM